jgi:hypothetical protein
MWSKLLSRMSVTLALSFGGRCRGVAGRTVSDDMRPMPHAHAAFDGSSEHRLPSGSEDIPLQCLPYRRLTALVSLCHFRFDK